MHHVIGASLNDAMVYGGVGHYGHLGVLGRMTVCAIIEHRRCRSRPNDQMREGSRGIDKVRVGESTLVQRSNYHYSNSTPITSLNYPSHYSLQQGILPNEGKTNELLMLRCMLPLQACPRLWLEALRLSFVCPPEILMIRKSSWIKSIFCLEPNQMTPQALHDSIWSMPLSLMRLASSPLTEKTPKCHGTAERSSPPPNSCP